MHTHYRKVQEEIVAAIKILCFGPHRNWERIVWCRVHGDCCTTLDIHSLVISSTRPWNMLDIYWKEHIYITRAAPCDTPCIKTLLQSQFLTISLQLKETNSHTSLSWLQIVGRPWGSSRRRGGPRVRLAKPGSAKQRLNLCKQALALLPNWLAAVWTGAWRELILWHGRRSYMFARACLNVIMLKTQAAG